MKKPHHFFVGLEGAVGSTFLDLGQSFGKASVNHAALDWCVLVFGAPANDRFRRKNDLATLDRGFHKVPMRQAYLSSELSRERHLALLLNFHQGHNFMKSGNPALKAEYRAGRALSRRGAS